MAVPAKITSLDITGRYHMNKTLSDSIDEILQLQGIGWLMRKGISVASVTMVIKNFKDATGVEHVDVDQLLTGGIPTTKEERVFDWKEWPKNDLIFGHIVAQTKRESVANIEQDYLKGNCEADDQEVIYIFTKSNTLKSGKTWEGIQVWGFEEINGERRHTRRIYFTGSKGQILTKRVVFDYVGPV